MSPVIPPRRARPPSRIAVLAVAGLAFPLGGCAWLQSSDSLLGVITPYRIEIVQGNVVTREQVALVKPGQTRAQVRDALGSPLLADPFHGDRWDYVFTIRRQGAPAQVRRVVVRFKGDVLESIDGASELPGEREFVASIDSAKSRTPPVLALTEEQVRALPAPAAAPPPAAASAAPTRTYPPLEPRP